MWVYLVILMVLLNLYRFIITMICIEFDRCGAFMSVYVYIFAVCLCCSGCALCF